MLKRFLVQRGTCPVQVNAEEQLRFREREPLFFSDVVGVGLYSNKVYNLCELSVSLTKALWVLGLRLDLGWDWVGS